MYTARREAAENTEKREIVDRRTYGHMCQSAHEWVWCGQFRKTVRPGSHTAGVAGRLWSEVAVASLKHPWDNKMRLPDENGGKDRRATFDDVGGHNVTTKTILLGSQPGLGLSVFFLSFFLPFGVRWARDFATGERD